MKKVVIIKQQKPLPKTPSTPSSRKKRTPKPSLRARRAILNFIDNGGKKGKAMIDAGYSPQSAHNPDKLFENPAIKPLLDPIIDQMRFARERAMRGLMKEKMKGIVPLSILVDKMTHNIQLLSGQETSRVHILTPEEKKTLDDAFDINK